MADEVPEFRINKEYADRYNKWREKEELQKLKDKYGKDGVEDDTSSTSEDEDDDAEALTSNLEKGWLRTLAAIKAKDPKIYDDSVNFYSQDGSSDSSDGKKKVKQKKDKPMFLQDYDRKVILEKEGRLSDEESSSEDGGQKELPQGYYEEQEEIRRSILEATGEATDSDSDDALLTRRKKTEQEQDHEEADYVEWLKGQKDELGANKQVGIELDPLKQYWNNPQLDEGEKFLRNYILDRQYMEDDDDDRIPTYEEIVQDEDISEEEKELEKQETFERKFNFRYEEPDPEFIKSYPRTIGDSVRRKDEKRAKKRQLDRDRKQQEKQKKMEELKQLKNLKKREIQDKLQQLREITGNPDVGFGEDDVDGDFDPKAHDRMMKKVFSEGYYEDETEDGKPVFDDDGDDDMYMEEEWDNWTGPSTSSGRGGEVEDDDVADCDDPDFNMDADYDPSLDPPQTSARGKKGKKKSKFAKALERQKPVFNPDDKTFEEYFDEYYKLDYEDIIDDVPCRFRYRQVTPSDYGLTMDEVLTCPDKELNAWASLKKMSQYRTEEEEKWEHRLFEKKGRNLRKKLHILPSLTEKDDDQSQKDSEAPAAEGKGKKRKRKRKGKANQEGDSAMGERQGEHGNQSGIKRKADDSNVKDSDVKRLKNSPSHASQPIHCVSKTTNNQKYSSETNNTKSGSTEPSVRTGLTQLASPGAGKSKRRRKRKKKAQSMTGVTSDRAGGTPRNKDTTGPPRVITPSRNPEKHKKKKKKKPKGAAGPGSKGFAVSADRLKAYGIDPKKFKYTQSGAQKIHVKGKS